MPHTITPSPTSRNTSRPRAQALCLVALAAALLCVHQKAACAQEPPSPGKKRACELLGPAFTFSSNHKKHFDAKSQRMAKIRRRWHADQLQEDGVNRDGSVWWYSIFVQNYQEWYLNNQMLAHLTVGETIKAKRQQQERDRAVLLAQAGHPPDREPDFEYKQDDGRPDLRAYISSLDYTPAHALSAAARAPNNHLEQNKPALNNQENSSQNSSRQEEQAAQNGHAPEQKNCIIN